MNTEIRNISLEELNKIENLNIRTYNVCFNSNLKTLKEIIDYFKEYSNFIRLRNCGKSANKELINICEKYEKTVSIMEIKPEDELQEIFKRLNIKQVAILDSIISTLINKFSLRVFNALSAYLNNNFSIKNIYEKIFANRRFRFENIQNIGKTSIPELECFKTEIYEYLQLVSLFDKDEYFEYEYYNSILNENYSKNEGSKFENFIIQYGQSKFENFINQLKEINSKAELQVTIEKLNIKQKAIINSIIELQLNNFSEKVYNTFSTYLKGDFSITNIYNNVLTDRNFSFKKIRDVSEYSIHEVEFFKTKISEYITLISLFVKEESETEYFMTILNKFFPKFDFSTLNKFVSFDNQIQIFNLINQLIENTIILDKPEKIVFENCFDYFMDFKLMNSDEIVPLLDLPRTRIKQLRNNIYENFNSKFQFLLSFNVDFKINYGIDTSLDLIFITKEKEKEINIKENTKFNRFFFSKIIYIYKSRYYDLIGNKKHTIFRTNKQFVNKWNSTYIVKRELAKIFAFEKFADDIYKRLNDENTEKNSFNFEHYLFDFFKKKDYSKIKRISKVCETIIFFEFDLVLDLEYNIVFRRNREIKNYELAIEILQETQRPLKIEEIYQKAIEKCPNLETTENSMAGSMRTNSDFIYIDHASTYGLKAWEKKHLNIKSDTIRNIVEEFLKKFPEPKHIDQITEYVIKFRPKTNRKSIFNNVRSEVNNRFAFFKDCFIGLKTIKYTGFVEIEDYYSKNGK